MTALDKMREAADALEAANTEFSAALLDTKTPSRFLAAKEAILQANEVWIDAVAEAYLANVAKRVEALR